MADVILKRQRQNENGTFGIMLMNDEQICVTCERPWQDNEPDVSCIPLGTYDVVKYSSPAHPNVWHVLNVPDRSDILIHNGNYPQDSAGCILVGRQYVMGMVTNSVDTLNMLRDELPDTFTLDIVNDLITPGANGGSDPVPLNS